MFTQKQLHLIAFVGLLSPFVAVIWDEYFGEPKLPVATRNPAVPLDLFSQRFLADRNGWRVAGKPTSELLRLEHGRICFRNEAVKQWFCTTGDRLCHGILSALLDIERHATRMPKSTETARKVVFAIYFEALLAELSLALEDRGVGSEERTLMLDRLASTILEQPLLNLSVYQHMLTLEKFEERAQWIANASAQRFNAPRKYKASYYSAYALLNLGLVMRVSTFNEMDRYAFC